MAKSQNNTETPPEDEPKQEAVATEEAVTEDAAKSDDVAEKEVPVKAAKETPVKTTPAEKEKPAKEPAKEKPAKQTKASSTTNSAKKDTPTRSKKAASGAKSGSLLPTEHQLENLKAAVLAAGSVENLLLIMEHVEEAGGKAEVEESIEAYRVLKTVLDE